MAEFVPLFLVAGAVLIVAVAMFRTPIDYPENENEPLPRRDPEKAARETH